MIINYHGILQQMSINITIMEIIMAFVASPLINDNQYNSIDDLYHIQKKNSQWDKDGHSCSDEVVKLCPFCGCGSSMFYGTNH